MKTGIVRQCVSAAVLLCGVVGAQAAVFQNGSFESPDLGPGGFATYGNGSTAITGWTVGATGGAQVYVTGTPSGFTLNATEGDQIFTLNGDANGAVTSISQAFDTVASTLYHVQFDLSRETPGGAPAIAPISIAATGNAAAFFNSDAGPWVSHDYFFVAAGVSTTLTISRTSAGEGNSPVLDNVTVDAVIVPPVVPEPAAGLLAGLGAAGLALAARNRRSLRISPLRRRPVTPV